MRFSLTALAAASLLALPGAASASLPVGAMAPQIVTQGAMGGKAVHFDLKAALKRGPVVLYFFPKAFTPGCTMEAHAFSEAEDQFKAMGASVIGMSADDLPALKRFSHLECRDKFPVAMASAATIKAYDVALSRQGAPSGMTDRVSYVIGQDGRIVLVHADMDYRDHVKLALEAVKKLKASRK